MNNKSTNTQKETLFLVLKKVHFEAIKDGLPRLSEEAIRRMAPYWLGSQDAMIQSLDKLQTKLKKAMSRPERVTRVLDRLPKRSYDLLYYILSEGGVMTREELQANFPADDRKTIADLLEPLLERGLVWELRSSSKEKQTARLFILETCSNMMELPSFFEGKFGTLLPNRTKEQLKSLVNSLGGDTAKLTRRHDVIPWLKWELRNPTRLRRLFDSLNLNDRRLLKILALHQDGLSYDELLYEFSLFTSKYPEEQMKKSLERLNDELGFIDIKSIQIEGVKKAYQQTIYRLPREAAEIIRKNFREKYRDTLPQIHTFKPLDEDFALGTRGKERPTLWIDFQQLLNHLIRCEVGVIRKGGMHKKNLKRILDRLEGHLLDAYLYLDFLFLYAYHKKILYPEGERWKINIREILPIQSEAAFYRDFWAFYRSNGSWNDRDSSPLQGVLQKGDNPQVFALRRAILRLLWDCPVGQWIETRVFFDELCDREMAFRCGEPPVISNDPMKEKFRFMKSTMERSLTWIGIVDTTTIPTQRISLFRLTEVGAWLLGSKTDVVPFTKPEEMWTLSIQPNMEILIPSSFPLEKQLFLARFTDDQKGRIILNRASIRRGLADGLTTREMMDFLVEHTQGYLPSNVEHLLVEVGEKASHIMVGGEPVRLEVHNQNLLDELLKKKQITPFIQERSGEKKVLIRRGVDLRKLMDELRKAGYTPRPL